MKLLKYVLGIVGVLAIIFFAAGLIKSEVNYDCEVTVDKPFEEAWAVSQDEDKLASWLDGYQKTERISGTPGTVGAVSDIHFIQDGSEMVIRETIKKVVPNESITMEFASDFMNMDYTIAMEPVDGKTKITSSTSCVGSSMIAKSVMALMSGSVKGQEETNLNNLKKTIEENTTVY